MAPKRRPPGQGSGRRGHADDGQRSHAPRGKQWPAGRRGRAAPRTARKRAASRSPSARQRPERRAYGNGDQQRPEAGRPEQADARRDAEARRDGDPRDAEIAVPAQRAPQPEKVATSRGDPLFGPPNRPADPTASRIPAKCSLSAQRLPSWGHERCGSSGYSPSWHGQRESVGAGRHAAGSGPGGRRLRGGGPSDDRHRRRSSPP